MEAQREIRGDAPRHGRLVTIADIDRAANGLIQDTGNNAAVHAPGITLMNRLTCEAG